MKVWFPWIPCTIIAMLCRQYPHLLGPLPKQINHLFFWIASHCCLLLHLPVLLLNLVFMQMLSFLQFLGRLTLLSSFPFLFFHFYFWYKCLYQVEFSLSFVLQVKFGTFLPLFCSFFLLLFIFLILISFSFFSLRLTVSEFHCWFLTLLIRYFKVVFSF